MKSASFMKTILTATGLRIFVLLAAGMIVSAVGVNYIFFKLQEQRLQTQVIQEGQGLAKIFASNVELGVFSGSTDLLATPVKSFLHHPNVLAIAIYDNAGKLIMARDVDPQTGIAGWGVSEASAGLSGMKNVPPTKGSSLTFQEPVLTSVSTAPVDDLYFEGTAPKQIKQIGLVQIRVSERQLLEGHKDFIKQSIMVSLAFLAVVLPLTFFIVNVSIRPLKHLLLRIKRQMGGLSSQADDIEQLDSTFSALLEGLEHSFQIINSMRENLEQQVAERTVALQGSNTHLEKTIEELKQAQMQLVHSEKMASLGLLSTGLAHEINNALTLIRGSIFPLEKVARQIVGAGGQASETHANAERLLGELIGHINTGVQRITLLIKDLMTFARPGPGIRHLVDLHEELEMTIRLLNIEARDGLDIEIRKEFGVLPPVSCQGGRISQVFLNILLNAIQAIQQKGYIRIVTAMEGDMVCIVIEDNGCGIAPEVLPKIFDPFFTTKEVGRGTGLGLGICYAIVREHGGKIKVASQVGKGTKFTITLPVSVIATEEKRQRLALPGDNL